MKNVQLVLAISAGILIVIAGLIINIITLKHCAILEEKLKVTQLKVEYEETYRNITKRYIKVNEMRIGFLKEDIDQLEENLKTLIDKTSSFETNQKRKNIIIEAILKELSKNINTNIE